MFAVVQQSNLEGKIQIPGSKSHMIRALYLGALANGESIIFNPAKSRDCLSCLKVCEALGAQVDKSDMEAWRIKGIQGNLKSPESILDVGNSGTTLYLGVGLASSINGYCVFTGDEQIRRRPIQPLINALTMSGVEVVSTRNNGNAPLIVKGPNKGGKIIVNGFISTYVSSVIFGCTLAQSDCEVEVRNVNEIPYIKMSLEWAKRVGALVEASKDMSKFYIKGNQIYSPFKYTIPADFSSAAFLLVAAAITDSEVTLLGLDMEDVQGDKEIIYLLQEMGADIKIVDCGRGGIVVKGGSKLKGRIIDCSNIPDSIPILSVLGCCAEGSSRLLNIGSSRLKESDRPLLMARELRKMGADIELTEKELIIKKSSLKGSILNSYSDHRIAMALSVAGIVAEGVTLVNNAESAYITFPDFDKSLRSLNANILFLKP